MTQLDDELAQATDALLEGSDPATLDGENGDLHKIAVQLYSVIDPKSPPSAAFQRRLVSRLNAEWDHAHAAPTLWLLDRPIMRLAALAAAVVIVLAAVVVLAVPDQANQLHGTAIGLHNAAAILALLGVAAVGAIVYWRNRR